MQSGSSPLARGLLCGFLVHLHYRGIIPARAGFTCLCSGTEDRTRDHPRSRGVYFPLLSISVVNSGSSPLARGLPWKHEADFTEAGIIPARAGFTQCSIMKVRTYTDHPRSRGVYVFTWGL